MYLNKQIKKGSNCCVRDHNVVRSIAMAAGVELLMDGNLISLACH